MTVTTPASYHDHPANRVCGLWLMKKSKGTRLSSSTKTVTAGQVFSLFAYQAVVQVIRKRSVSQLKPIPNLPPELWANIASFSSRPTIGSLSLVSRTFNSVFSPHLYSNLLKPRLTSALLLQALRREPSSLPGLYHPASLIRKLGVIDDCSVRTPAQSQTEPFVHALNNLRLLPLSDERGSSVLRVLHWGIEAGIDELGRILGSPGSFPHLRELFIQVPGLKVLGFKVVRGNFRTGLLFIEKREDLIRNLLMLSFNYWEEVFPQGPYRELVAAINLIRLPYLRSLKLEITCNTDDLFDGYFDSACEHFGIPPTDLSTFLAAHPSISYLCCGLSPVPQTTVKSLKRLRSFTGSFQHSCIISSEDSKVQRVALTFQEHDYTDQKLWIESTPPTSHPSVTSVTIHAVDKYGDLLKYPCLLDSKFYSRLASSFPSITHLDIVLGQRLKHFRESIISLPDLEYLSVQEYRIQYGQNKINPVDAFPANKYILQLNALLSALTSLDEIDVCILADYSDWDFDDEVSY
ncbi:hypothetical protein C8J57DRAFT_1254497 [Mycena rebaudengoi]|nr:hypothetical protein C8J57DRAFT_1254497 [Mycena rebaudengoi]